MDRGVNDFCEPPSWVTKYSSTRFYVESTQSLITITLTEAMHHPTLPVLYLQSTRAMKLRKGKAYKARPSDYGRSYRERRSLESQVAGAVGRPRTRTSHEVAARLQVLTSTPPDSPSVSAPAAGRSELRSQFVPCHHYGPDRRMVYPGYFFCNPCDLYEASANGMSQRKIKKDAKQWICQAHHKFFAFPSEKCVPDSIVPSVKDKTKTSVEVDYREAESDKEPDCPSVEEVAAPDRATAVAVQAVEEMPKTTDLHEVHLSQIIEQQETQIKTLKTALWDSDDEIVSLRRKLARLEHKLDALESVEQGKSQEPPDQPVPEPMAEGEQPVIVESEEEKTARQKNVACVQSAIDDAINGTRLRNDDSIDSVIAEAVWSQEYRNGGVFKALLKLACAWLRTNVFPAWKVLRELDDKGGTANYEACELFRRVETGNQRYYRGSILPCAADLKRAAKVLEREADKTIPVTQGVTASGAEMVSLDPKAVLLFLLGAFHLYEIAKFRPVEVAVALDAANLTKYLSHTTAGLKVIDHGARCPRTNMPLLSKDLSGDDLVAQSSTLCYPIRMIAEGETHQSIKEFEADYALLDSLTEDGQLICPEIKPISLTQEGD